MKVAVCGPDRLMRRAVAEVLELEPDIEVVAVKRTAGALAAARGQQRVDVVLVYQPEGVAVPADEIRRQFPDVAAVYVERSEETERMEHEQLVAPSAGFAQLVMTLRAVAAAQPRVAVIGSVGVPADGGEQALTDREVQILRLIGRGDTAASIADALGITAKTVDSHKRRIYAKLGVQSQTHAVSVALREGLLSPEAPRLRGSESDR